MDRQLLLNFIRIMRREMEKTASKPGISPELVEIVKGWLVDLEMMEEELKN